MRLLVIALLLAALAGALAPRGDTAVSVRTHVDAVGFPFWCGWSYDWEARSADWYHEREPDYYWIVKDVAELDTSAGPDVVACKLTGLVREWLAGGIANNGVLLKLTDASENFDVGGFNLASMDADEPSVRPRLAIVYSSPTGTAR